MLRKVGTGLLVTLGIIALIAVILAVAVVCLFTAS